MFEEVPEIARVDSSTAPLLSNETFIGTEKFHLCKNRYLFS